jgi:LacI family transcriptional regulator
MKPSIVEVAQLAGVSIATVSYVLNGTKRVRPETAQKVMDAVEKLQYQINPLARNFRKGESKLIGFVVCDLSNYFFQDIALGLEQCLNQYGYRPILIDSKEDKQIEMENVRNLLGSAVDGLILAPTAEDVDYLQLMLRNHPVPVVFVDRKTVGHESDMVLSENTEGGYQAVKCLIERGHREIAFLGSRRDSTIEERAQGYRDALREAGIRVNENYIRYGEDASVSQRNLLHGSIYNLTAHLLKHYPITAIFSANNLATVGAFNYLMEAGLQVPDDIAFITFDDSFWLSMTTPSLSAVAQHPEEIGRLAGRLIYRRILDQQKNISRPYELKRVPTKLVLRRSC